MAYQSNIVIVCFLYILKKNDSQIIGNIFLTFSLNKDFLFIAFFEWLNLTVVLDT